MTITKNYIYILNINNSLHNEKNKIKLLLFQDVC